MGAMTSSQRKVEGKGEPCLSSPVSVFGLLPHHRPHLPVRSC